MAKRRSTTVLLILLGGLSGCHLPAARFAAPAAGSWDEPCSLALGRQVLADSAIKCFCHPLHTAWGLCYETADHLAALAHGEVGKRVVLPLHGPPEPLPAGRQLVTRAAEDRLPADLQPAHVELHTDGTAALLSLERLIDEAEHSVAVLMFEWENDDIGQRIANKLAAKACPGVRVRLLVDGGSNLVFAHPRRESASAANRVLCALAGQPHVEVLRVRNAFARFDHRKLVVVDGRAAWTGGRNFMRRAFFEDRDLSVTVTGPLVAAVQRRFEACWREHGGSPSEPAAPARVDATSVTPNAWGRLIETLPGKHELQSALYKAVDDARHYVYVENVYFTDSRLVYKLAQARRRGADVRVVLTVQGSCSPINRATRVLANRLLRAGVRVYLYPGTTHAKVAVVDGAWAYIGTANFDALSLRHNRELGVVLAAGSAIAELEEKLFAADFRDEWELREPLPVTVKDYLCEVLASLWL